jgi:hypothetical protein
MIYGVGMHIVVNKSGGKNGKLIYKSILLRESYRVGKKVKKRTIANLSNCSRQDIEAMKLALKYKDDLSELGSLKDSVDLEEWKSVGAVWAVYQTAKQIGIEKVLGDRWEAKLALWQILARVIDQGSLLSAVRLARFHASCDILGIKRGFDENDLYENLRWLSDRQAEIEDGLFRIRNKDIKLFLYDVTSSYLEGEKNYYGRYGYNRDKKKGKQQIVIGLLCDGEGEPVAIEVFSGNTNDTKTVASQVQKLAKRFGCDEVTLVGDRGMLKDNDARRCNTA